MIKNTFSMLSGIGIKLEKRLWRRGITDWDGFISTPGIDFISDDRKALLDLDLKDADIHLKQGNSAYFSEKLKPSEHWRLYDFFKEGAVCLDIETNGYQVNAGGYTTVVGLYDGKNYVCLTRGKNLTAERLTKELSKHKYLITFYGSVFDMPFLISSLPGFKFDMPHFDLCFAGKKVGLSGGLKKIEQALGINRDSDTMGLDGYDAVLLWRRAQKGDKKAMDILVKYNKEDTVNLLHIADIVYGKLIDNSGIKDYAR